MPASIALSCSQLEASPSQHRVQVRAARETGAPAKLVSHRHGSHRCSEVSQKRSYPAMPTLPLLWLVQDSEKNVCWICLSRFDLVHASLSCLLLPALSRRLLRPVRRLVLTLKARPELDYRHHVFRYPALEITPDNARLYSPKLRSSQTSINQSQTKAQTYSQSTRSMHWDLQQCTNLVAVCAGLSSDHFV